MTRFSKRWWLALALLLVPAGWLLFGWYAGPRVSTVRVVSRPLTQTVVATGRVGSDAESQLGSTVTARVVATPVVEGQRVRRGTLLLRLESDEAAANLAQARAALAESAATLAEARRLYQRQQALFGQGFISAAALDAQHKALSLAETRHDAARAQLASAEARLAQLTITAPDDGTLISRDAEVGDLLTAGRPVLTFAPAGHTVIKLDVDERFLARLRPGQVARVAADAYPEQPADAVVDTIAPQVDRVRGTVEVTLRLRQLPPFLSHNMTVSAEVVVAHKAAALLVPAGALQGGTPPWLWRVVGGRVQRQAVGLGVVLDGQAEVTTGLAPGDVVLTVPPALHDGQRVRAEEE